MVSVSKARFIEVAHLYYALAVTNYVDQKGSSKFSLSDIKGYYTSSDNEFYVHSCVVSHDFILRRAISWLEDQGMLEMIEDDFGPSIISTTNDYVDKYRALQRDRSTPFFKAAVGEGANEWTWSALQKLTTEAINLGITELDFDAPVLDEWSPLPLDRNDPTTVALLEPLDEAIEWIRSNNGYASSAPEERDFILTSLSQFRGKLRDAVNVSVPFVKSFVVEPIKVLSRRFGGFAGEATLEAFKVVFKAWLIKNGLHYLKLD